MKKKLIAIAIAAAVAAPLTAQAAVSVSGDAEFQMVHNEEGGPGVGGGGWAGTNRVRVKVDADLGEGVSVHTRFRTTTGFDNSGATAGSGALTVDTDYSHLNVKVGNASLQMGDQLATWGTKYFIEGARKDNRMKVGFKISNQLKAGLMLDPHGDENGDGAPHFTVNAVYKVSNMMTAGIMIGTAYTKYDGTAAGTDVDGWNDIFVIGSMSGVNYGIELKSNAGSSTDAADGSGRYIMVGSKMGGMNIALHNADSKAGAQDGDWSPIGVINGDAGIAGASKQASTTVITLDTKAAGFDVTVGVGSAGADGATESLVGIDLGKKFGAADFNFSFGSHDSNSAFGFSFETKF